MVHKVTMDTVRIITSSVSGMTNVSWHTGLHTGADGSGLCRARLRGDDSTGPELCTVASPIPTIWEDGGPQIFQLPELVFQDSVPWAFITFTRAVLGTQ